MAQHRGKTKKSQRGKKTTVKKSHRGGSAFARAVAGVRSLMGGEGRWIAEEISRKQAHDIVKEKGASLNRFSTIEYGDGMLLSREEFRGHPGEWLLYSDKNTPGLYDLQFEPERGPAMHTFQHTDMVQDQKKPGLFAHARAWLKARKHRQ